MVNLVLLILLQEMLALMVGMVHLLLLVEFCVVRHLMIAIYLQGL